MDQFQRSRVATGAVLILIGALWLVTRLTPALSDWVGAFTWPLIIVGVGLVLLVIGLLTGVPGMAIPACIVGGIGALLYWQNSTDNWASWAYAWALIPGFAGVGTILAGILGGDRKMARGGGWTVLISLVMFGVFGALLGGPAVLGDYWPLLLILLGMMLAGRTIMSSRKS